MKSADTEPKPFEANTVFHMKHKHKTKLKNLNVTQTVKATNLALEVKVVVVGQLTAFVQRPRVVEPAKGAFVFREALELFAEFLAVI